MTEIKLCMGSSCFARGNNEILDFLEAYIQKEKLDSRVELTGCRCTGACDEGPNLFIDEKPYHGMTREKLLALLEELKQRG